MYLVHEFSVPYWTLMALIVAFQVIISVRVTLSALGGVQTLFTSFRAVRAAVRSFIQILSILRIAVSDTSGGHFVQ